MSSKLLGGALVLSVALAVIISTATPATAQLGPVSQSNGQIYFNSDSNTYQMGNPVTTPTGALSPVFPPGALPGVPGAPAGGASLSPSFSFPAPGGFNFSAADPLIPGQTQTTASANVVASLGPAITVVTDPQITAIGSGTSLVQSSNAPGYAFEQFDFDAYYPVGTAGLSSAVKTTTAHITGNLVASGANPSPFAEFGYTINYYFIINSTVFPLGTVDMYQSWSGAGPINATVTSAPTLISGVSPYSLPEAVQPVLEVTGTMFLAGDPAVINADVEDTVPEPATLAIGMIVSTILLTRRRVRAD